MPRSPGERWWRSMGLRDQPEIVVRTIWTKLSQRSGRNQAPDRLAQEKRASRGRSKAAPELPERLDRSRVQCAQLVRGVLALAGHQPAFGFREVLASLTISRPNRVSRPSPPQLGHTSSSSMSWSISSWRGSGISRGPGSCHRACMFQVFEALSPMRCHRTSRAPPLSASLHPEGPSSHNQRSSRTSQ